MIQHIFNSYLHNFTITGHKYIIRGNTVHSSLNSFIKHLRNRIELLITTLIYYSDGNITKSFCYLL